MKERILIIAAHPDDDILGCGGTIKLFSKKKYNISSIFFTDGEKAKNNFNKKNITKRRDNSLTASKIIGVKDTYFFDYNDQMLDNYPLIELTKSLETLLKKIRPTIIFTHFHKDINKDHQIVNQVVSTATRPNCIKGLKKIFYFEVLSSTEWNNKETFNPNYFVDISKTINQKINAFKKFPSEIRSWPHSRSLEGIRTLAKYRGMQAGKNYCEAFMVAKIIN